jgi:hypothetical protein
MRIPAQAATPGKSTLQDGVWTTRQGNRKPLLTPEIATSDMKGFPNLAEFITPTNDNTRWVDLDVDKLTTLLGSIATKVDVKSVSIGIPDEYGKPISVISGDGRGIGLIMPRCNGHKAKTDCSDAWNTAVAKYHTAQGKPQSLRQ